LFLRRIFCFCDVFFCFCNVFFCFCKSKMMSLREHGQKAYRIAYRRDADTRKNIGKPRRYDIFDTLGSNHKSHPKSLQQITSQITPKSHHRSHLNYITSKIKPNSNHLLRHIRSLINHFCELFTTQGRVAICGVVWYVTYTN